MIRRALFIRASLLALILVDRAAGSALAQSPPDDSVPAVSSTTSLGLSAERAAQLQQAIGAHDYLTAEKILLAEIARDPHSPATGRMLAFAGTVYFLDHDYLNAAIAWKKSEAIAPLTPELRFSQAMAYIRIAHPEWARQVLDSLASQDPHNALYPYWLGRLDYDAHEYNRAILHFRHAIELDPKMARAYDNLGLCYYYQNQNALAVDDFKKAIALDQDSPHPSPWPYLNLAITQHFLNQLPDAETSLRTSLRLDPSLASAHFQLGTVLEDLGRLDEAVAELNEAARLDANYAEPHMALARIYHKLGKQQEAKQEVAIYLRLHPHSTP